MMFPEAIDDHAGDERVSWAGEPVGELGAQAGGFLAGFWSGEDDLGWVQYFGEGGLHRVAGGGGVAALEDEGGRGLGADFLDAQGFGIGGFFSLFEFLELLAEFLVAAE